jgi:hypothetical protein
VSLTLGLEFPSLLRVPRGVVTRGLRRLGVKTRQFPVVAFLLQNESQRDGILATGNIQNRDRVFARRQIIQHKYGAVLGLAGGSENATEEFSPGKRLGPFRGQQERRADRGFGAAKGRLIILDGSFDASKIRRHGGNGTLSQRSRIATRRHIEITLGGILDRRAHGVIHI